MKQELMWVAFFLFCVALAVVFPLTVAVVGTWFARGVVWLYLTVFRALT